MVDEKQGVRFARQYEHIVIDTPVRPDADELKTIAQGCDILILPTSPDAFLQAEPPPTRWESHKLRSLRSWAGKTGTTSSTVSFVFLNWTNLSNL